MRRVVITGLGTVNALGLDVASSYPRILAGENGVTTLDRFDTTGITATIAAQVTWSPEDCGFDVKDQRQFDDLVARLSSHGKRVGGHRAAGFVCLLKWLPTPA